jgi:hypothetical protein
LAAKLADQILPTSRQWTIRTFGNVCPSSYHSRTRSPRGNAVVFAHLMGWWRCGLNELEDDPRTRTDLISVFVSLGQIETEVLLARRLLDD